MKSANGSRDSIGCHLISDVPLGAFLSSGLNSGTILALGSQILDAPMSSFTLAFDNWSDDERNQALLTANRWHSNHQTRVISAREVLNDLPIILNSMDQPTLDGLNSWYISREAKQVGLTVSLSGVGGDELFAGYPSFTRAPLLKYFPQNLNWLGHLPFVNRIANQSDSRRKLFSYLSGDTPFNHPYFAIRGLFTETQIQAILSSEAKELLRDGSTQIQSWEQAALDQTRLASQYDPVNEISWLEISQYMRSTLLRDTDMMSMAHSLEVRVPFVDHKLIQNVLPVLGKHKIQQGKSKPLLANAVRDMLPPEILSLKKRTFTFPFEDWLQHELSTNVKSSFAETSEKLGKCLSQAGISGIWHEFQKGRTNWARPWALYVLNRWTQEFL